MSYNTINFNNLQTLKDKGKANPGTVKTVKCRTVAKQKFQHLNYIRDLPPHIIDEPPVLLGDDTAPNPSEAALAALGSCISVGIQANLVDNNIEFSTLSLNLEADINISSVWGVGDTSKKPVGFTAVRITVDTDAKIKPQALDDLVNHVLAWSPVTGTYVQPVPVTIALVS